MPDNSKKIADAIQEILDNNNGFLSISSLDKLMNRNLKAELGFKSADSMKIKAKKLIAATGDRFILRDKRRSNMGKSQMSYYILTPRDPEELILSMLSQDDPMTPKGLARKLPFTNRDVCTLLNELVKGGKVQTMYDETLEPKMYLAAVAGGGEQRKPSPSGEYSVAKFREAYDELHKEREFVRICDIRRKLGWPASAFDAMLVYLRDKETIQLHIGDNSLMTQDEIKTSFVDELGELMGTVTWHVR